MQYETIEHKGEYNSEGAPIFVGTRNLENTFDETTITKIVSDTEKRIEDINNAVLSAQTNIKINSDVLAKITPEGEMSDDTIAGAEIYFRNVKELKAIQGAIPGIEAELGRWKETLAKLQALNIPNKDAGETNSQEVTNPTE